MNVGRGYRCKLSELLDTDKNIEIRMKTAGTSVFDTSCFGVDRDDRLSDDRYMIFYNQPESPKKEITLTSDRDASVYSIALASLPDNINKLVFTVSIDGNGTMGQIQEHQITVLQNGNIILQTDLSGSDFKDEKAIIDLEIYKKDEWRVSVVARGYNGGLADLLKDYGGELADNTEAVTPKPSASPETAVGNKKDNAELADRLMKKISLSKDRINLEKHVINLSKSVYDIRQKTGYDLGNVNAKVAVVLDFSGSMKKLYLDGTVQKTLNRLVPLGLTFDDNGSIDLFLFHSGYIKIKDLDLSNYDDYVKKVIIASGYKMGTTNYAPVLNAIILGDKLTGLKPIVDDSVPTFVLFITDGANADKGATNRIIKESSGMNVFIQFIGIGAESFDYLMKLDDISGRVRDNTGFTKMADLNKVDDNVLYMEVLNQFSAWLKGLQ